MKKFTNKVMNTSAEIILDIALISYGLASNFGSYQEKEPTELLQKKCREMKHVKKEN